MMFISHQLLVRAARLDIATKEAECDSSAATEPADIGCFFDNVEH